MSFGAITQVSNMTLMSQYAPSGMPVYSGVVYNDVWGYTSGTGQEYALLGTADSIVIVKVDNCINTERVAAFYGGGHAIWRDIKVYGNYAYSVCDGCSEGLKIIDMSNIDSGTISVSTETSFFTKAHNIFVDASQGRLYACGTNTGSGTDLVVLDVATSPGSPSLLSNIDFNTITGGTTNFYIHDLYVDNNIAYCSHGPTGLYIWDLSDLNNIPLTTKSYDTPGYSHSSWPTNDKSYIYSADENYPGQPITVLQNTSGGLLYKTTISQPLESSGLPTVHNPFVVGNLLYVSNYEDGLQVWDISNPASPSRTAYYDTYPDNNGGSYTGYEGAWGVYPFFDSGCIVATDITYGAFFLKMGIIMVPVTWKSFDVSLNKNNESIVHWATESEQNNSHFNIMRSQDAIHFEKIGQVQGNDNSSTEKNYEFVDSKSYVGVNYYRIDQIDHDGNKSSSDIKSVNLSLRSDQITLFPNPVTNDVVQFALTSTSNQSYLVEIFDNKGLIVSSNTLNIDPQVQKNVYSIALGNHVINGQYTLRLTSNNTIVWSQSLMVLR